MRFKRHDDQRHQQHHGKHERDHLADDEVMASPVAIDRADPGADAIGGHSQHEALRRRQPADTTPAGQQKHEAEQEAGTQRQPDAVVR